MEEYEDARTYPTKKRLKSAERWFTDYDVEIYPRVMGIQVLRLLLEHGASQTYHGRRMKGKDES